MPNAVTNTKKASATTAVLAAAVTLLGAAALAPVAEAGLGRQNQVNMSINLTQTVVRANTLVTGHSRRRRDSSSYGGYGSYSTPKKEVSLPFYTTSVVIDETGQKFDAQFKTTTGDTWFRGPQCTSSLGDCPSGGPVVDTSKLTLLDGCTFTEDGGNVTGQLYSGHLTLKGAKVALDFGVTTHQEEFYLDGVIGYGTSTGIKGTEESKQSNFFQELGLKGDQDGFGLFLAPSGFGTLTLGGYDGDRVKGDINCTPHQGGSTGQDWSFKSEATFSCKGASGVSTCETFTPDLSTAFIEIDDKLAATVNKVVGGKFDEDFGLYTIDCGVKDKGPTVTITLDGNKFDIKSSCYVVETDDNLCLSGFQGGANDGKGTLGQPFLKSFYSIYDRANSQTCFGHYDPPPPPPKKDTCSGVDYRCPTEGGQAFQQCDHNAWVTLQCAAGTVCHSVLFTRDHVSPCGYPNVDYNKVSGKRTKVRMGGKKWRGRKAGLGRNAALGA